MLPKENRLDRRAVEEVFSRGRFVTSPRIAFRFIKTPGRIKKIAFIAPKGIAKEATKRNLLRRRGYAAIKKYMDALPEGIVGAFIFGRAGVSVFSGRKTKNMDPFHLLSEEIKSVLKKI